MAVMFNQSSTDGAVITVLGTTKKAAILKIDNKDAFIANMPCIITGFGVNQNVNAMVSPTLGNLTYIYGFGDTASQLSFRGLAFPGKNEENKESGSTAFLAWYKTNKFSTKFAPITLEICGDAFRTYVMSSSLDVQMTGMNLTMQFTVSGIGVGT